jgi:hypothetical protein
MQPPCLRELDATSVRSRAVDQSISSPGGFRTGRLPLERSPGSPSTDPRASSKRLSGLFKETRRSFQRDPEVSSKRLGSLFQETRRSLQRDSGVSSRRLGGLIKETRGSLPGDSRVSSRRLGGLIKETRGSLPGDSRISSKRLEGLFQETRGSLPRDSGVFKETQESLQRDSGLMQSDSDLPFQNPGPSCVVGNAFHARDLRLREPAFAHRPLPMPQQDASSRHPEDIVVDDAIR